VNCAEEKTIRPARLLSVVLLPALCACTVLDTANCEIIIPDGSTPAAAEVLKKIEAAFKPIVTRHPNRCQRFQAGFQCFLELGNSDLFLTSRMGNIMATSSRRDEIKADEVSAQLRYSYTTLAPWTPSRADFDAGNREFAAAVQKSGLPHKAECRTRPSTP
jgi:hypothetical protein